MIFVEVKALAGANYVRAADVIAVQAQDPKRCVLVMHGGATVPCAESAGDVVERLEAALAAAHAPAEDDKQGRA